MAKDTKSVGAITGLEFAFECIRRGAAVSEPIGDNSRYDFIVDNGKQLLRVQVKTASELKPGIFNVNGTRKIPQGDKVVSVPYEKGELDCLVTKAAGFWFFFPEPHTLKGIIQVRPDAAPGDYKWNFGKDNWACLGLPQLPL
jgi:hypothetical protein